MEENNRFGRYLDRTLQKNTSNGTEIPFPATGLRPECSLQQELYPKVLFYILFCIVAYSFCILSYSSFAVTKDSTSFGNLS